MEPIFSLVEQANIIPDEVLVHGLIDAYGRLKDAAKLAAMFEKCKRLGVIPTMHIYLSLIRVFGHLRSMDHVWATYVDQGTSLQFWFQRELLLFVPHASYLNPFETDVICKELR